MPSLQGTPQCVKGCPIENNIPEFIHQLSKGNMGSAMKIINETKQPACDLRSCLPSRKANVVGIVFSWKERGSYKDRPSGKFYS